MSSKKGLKLLLVVLLISIVVTATFYIKIPYTVNGNGVISPSMEWKLEKTADGIILNSLKNNLTNTYPHFSSTEFQRGDHVNVEISKNLNLNDFINKGDTIGRINSHLESFKLLELKGRLEEQKRGKLIHQTGEKPELITAAHQQMIMAQNEYETEKRLFQRTQSLYQDNIIAEQEYEVAQNKYTNKKHQLEITRANYEAISSGEKQERVEQIDATINSIKEQINMTKKRLDAFYIISPISGNLTTSFNTQTNTGSLARIINKDTMVLLFPIEVNQIQYLNKGMPVTIKNGASHSNTNGEIVFIDSNVEQINQRQTVFISSIINNNNHQLKPNLRVSAQINCGNISVAEYLKRLSKTIYHN